MDMSRNAQRAHLALAAWYAAEDRARELERCVRDASLRRESDGTPVSLPLLREMLRARADADLLLREAATLPARSHA